MHVAVVAVVANVATDIPGWHATPTVWAWLPGFLDDEEKTSAQRFVAREVLRRCYQHWLSFSKSRQGT